MKNCPSGRKRHQNRGYRTPGNRRYGHAFGYQRHRLFHGRSGRGRPPGPAERSQRRHPRPIRIAAKRAAHPERYVLQIRAGTLRPLDRTGRTRRKREVSLGESSYEYVEIADGLNEGDRVILSDMERYKDKQTLKIRKTNSPKTNTKWELSTCKGSRKSTRPKRSKP